MTMLNQSNRADYAPSRRSRVSSSSDGRDDYSERYRSGAVERASMDSGCFPIIPETLRLDAEHEVRCDERLGGLVAEPMS